MSYAKYIHDIIVLVDTLIQYAIQKNVSDIHLEPTEQDLRVRFRVDGLLYDQENIVQSVAQQVCARIEVLGNIDSSQKRIPHDGTFSIVHDNRPIDLRISTFPSLHGPKIVIRILDRKNNNIALGQLGMNTKVFEQFNELIKKSSGFFLVSGPTGSGKTTTLYAALSELNSPEKHIITLEDPVEYNVPGITQGHIYPPAGFTFEKGMRSLLRHDPDIVMVGEIRDKQTAHIAIEAALTGHLVFSTVHTNDAVQVVMRLIDMGIEPFLINAALTGVLAQRLVRKICTVCKESYEPNDEEKNLLKELSSAASINKLHRGVGCNACNNTGYKGRMGIFQLLEVSAKLRSLISAKAFVDDLYQQASIDGMNTLFADGFEKVKNGETTLSELVRVLL